MGQRHANDLGSACHAQSYRYGLGQVDLQVVNRTTGCVGRAADIQNELRDAFNVLHGVAKVDTSLKPVTGISGKVVASRAAGNGLGPPVSRFNVDVAGVVRHRGGVAAHDASQGLDLNVVGDHTHFFVNCDRVAIEQLQGLARLAPPNVKTAVDLVKIKNMTRTAQLKHHVVGYVHQRRHAALTATRQAIHHPGRCRGLGVKTAHDTA